jgi:malate dehydrogenase (oxaloacetate-decarboxylating)(NADP+)
MTSKRPSLTDEEALAFHRHPRPGKLSVTPTKPMATQKDLSLAYSPGVAVPVHAIARDPDAAYDYTSKGNMVAVISNGTAILGLGDLGPLASKPVMEGKAVLFKRFADVDSIDIEVDEKDPQKFIDCVRAIGATFGGINLEDIKAPECFIIESELREKLDIPVFHDDQHGTAIIATAGLINACEITGRKLSDCKVVITGAGAAGLSVAGLIRHLGVKRDNILMVDRKGVIYEGRTEGMDQFKSAFAVKTKKRTLMEAFEGADVFMGLSAKGMVTKDMVARMAKNPMIFPMANPDPEITPEEVREVRSDAIIATGRSDYPNQINNVLGFPYIFRGALDVRARTINEEMKVAAARALAQLAREDVPDEVAAAYSGSRLTFGPDYIIPAPFDPRLIWYVPPFVAQAAMDTGVARKPIADMQAYRDGLAQRLDPAASFLQRIHGAVRRDAGRKRIVFAEGEEPAVIRAAWQFKTQELGEPILVGREEQITRNMQLVGLTATDIKIVNARVSDQNTAYTDFLYKRLQRQGYLLRDAQRLINQDRNVFAACMVAMGHADGMVTGVTRNYATSLSDILLAIDRREDVRPIGVSIVIGKAGPMLIADTSVTEMPGAQDLAEIAISAARAAQKLGFTPKLAFLSYSTFGNPPGERMEKVRDGVALLDAKGNVGFEYDGEMAVDVALNPDARRLYPFARLTGPANVLVMPAIHSASISTKMAAALGGATVIGPLLVGLKSSVQIAQLDATVQDIVNLAAFAAYNPNS